jgi:uncharacterized membrane protein YGL010W
VTSETNLVAEYGDYHRDRRNLVCHEIGIPLIVLAIIALLRLVALPGHLTLATVAVVALEIYYIVAFWQVFRAAVLLAVVGLLALSFIAMFVSWPVAIAAFVAGWIFQFVGHAYEGKSPAFLTNLLHLLVGPLWVASHLVPTSASSSSAR